MTITSEYQSTQNIVGTLFESGQGVYTSKTLTIRQIHKREYSSVLDSLFSYSTSMNGVDLENLANQKPDYDSSLSNSVGSEWLTLNQYIGVYNMSDKQFQKFIMEMNKETSEKMSRIEERIDYLYREAVTKNDLKNQIEAHEKNIIEKIDHAKTYMKNWIYVTFGSIIIYVLSLFLNIDIIDLLKKLFQ